MYYAVDPRLSERLFRCLPACTLAVNTGWIDSERHPVNAQSGGVDYYRRVLWHSDHFSGQSQLLFVY